MLESNIKERLRICESCPIYSSARGLCNPNLYLNPETNDVSSKPKEGYIKGCGCYIKFKMKNINNHCVAGKW